MQEQEAVRQECALIPDIRGQNLTPQKRTVRSFGGSTSAYGDFEGGKRPKAKSVSASCWEEKAEGMRQLGGSIWLL